MCSESGATHSGEAGLDVLAVGEGATLPAKEELVEELHIDAGEELHKELLAQEERHLREAPSVGALGDWQRLQAERMTSRGGSVQRVSVRDVLCRGGTHHCAAHAHAASRAATWGDWPQSTQRAS
jgi:hypothetical protein